MNAEKVAKALRAAGIPVIQVEQGDDCMDGAVHVTELVHVQVPTVGSYLNVVQEVDGGEAFKFYPETKSLVAIVADVRQALGMVTK